MKSVITFIRHGESIANVDKSFYHLPDPTIILSTKGVMQCVELMNTIHSILSHDQGHLYTTFITSEFIRAKLSANIVTAKLRLHSPIIHDRRLNEAYYCVQEVRLTETRHQIKQRILSLINQYPFNLVLFCHGQMMDAIDYKMGGARNCEVRTYDRDDLINNYLLSTEGDSIPIETKQ